MSAGPGKGTGTWTRVGIGLQVGAVVVLAAVAAGILTWLSARPGLWVRTDLTAQGRQTLDGSLASLIEQLPRKVTAEVFFRPLEKPLDQVGSETQQRMLELLFVARNQLPEQLKVVEHDLSDVGVVSERMQELGIDETNVIVLHDGERQVVLRLLRDLARVNPGNPAARMPPSLEAFIGDQALGNALLQLAIDRSPKIYFSTGQGERDLYGTEILQLGTLHSALIGDGFEVASWSPSEDPNVPADCDVLAVIDPAQPFPSEAIESMHGFAARGGRFLITPSKRRKALDGPGSMAAFLRTYGIEVLAGFIAQPIMNSLGQATYGDPRCSSFYIGPEGMDRNHPVTKPLWSVQRRVVMGGSRAFRRGTAPENAKLLDLLRTPSAAWQDLPAPTGEVGDWRWNQRLEESGSFTLALAAFFEATDPPAQSELEDLGTTERFRTRILAFGSPDALGNGESSSTGPIEVNRDLALNVFNWLASRDHRTTIRPREYVARVLNLSSASTQRTLNRVTLMFLPGVCLLIGGLVWWRRRR